MLCSVQGMGDIQPRFPDIHCLTLSDNPSGTYRTDDDNGDEEDSGEYLNQGITIHFRYLRNNGQMNVFITLFNGYRLIRDINIQLRKNR